jgi:hypothetical protein
LKRVTGERIVALPARAQKSKIGIAAREVAEIKNFATTEGR